MLVHASMLVESYFGGVLGTIRCEVRKPKKCSVSVSFEFIWCSRGEGISTCFPSMLVFASLFVCSSLEAYDGVLVGTMTRLQMTGNKI